MMPQRSVNGGGGPGSSQSTGPVGQGDYVVKQGDCIESIAFERGLFWQTVWNHSGNRELREKRKDPNVLLPGDKVYVPKIREKRESGGTEQRHRFRRRGVPSKLKLRFLDEEKKPRAGEQYVLEVAGKTLTGSLDGDGVVQAAIPPNARKAKITVVGSGGEQEAYEMDLGGLDPITEVSGIQARLNNLGYDSGPVDGILGRRTEAALQVFQADYDLEVTGEMNQVTRDKLLEAYDKKETAG